MATRLNRSPVLAAWGGGVDSTAMLVEMVEAGDPVDAVLFADVGNESQATYAFIKLFTQWLEERGIPVHVVRYVPQRFKHWPPYYSLLENALTNATLPSIAFSRHTCSLKWKVAPQDAWAAEWILAKQAWSEGRKVIKLLGYDCSPADQKRYAHAASLGEDDRYSFRYPLRELGWMREDCKARIAAAGLPVPPKSSCTFCSSQKPSELMQRSAAELRQIVLMEARAKPRLRNIDGLWRKPVKGSRGATPRPGSMTEFIRSEGLLPSDEIDRIIALAPAALVSFQEAAAAMAENRPTMGQWLRLFEAVSAEGFTDEGARKLYSAFRGETSSAAPEIECV